MNIRLSAPFRLILAALLVLSLQACATRGTEIGTSAPSDASNAAWQAYQGYASARASDHDPYRLSGSLRYGSQGDTRRVETLLWSNGYLPIRLDVMAGIGALVARIQETQDSFTAYAPNENKAIVHKGPQRVQLNFGRPVPFSLRDFSSLMRGRFHEVFGAAEGLNPRALPNGDIAFTLSGGILPIALILTMGSSLILGMGLPTAAAYLICAAVIVPALTGLGVPALTGHLFIFYFACLSAITPPVALAAFTAASLGKTKPMGVALTAVRLGIVAFIVPFMFVYAPSLLWQGSLPEILGTLATSLCGVFFLGSALQGAFRDRVLNMGQRGLFLLGSLALIQPGLVTDLIGVGLVACALLWQWLGSRRG